MARRRRRGRRSDIVTKVFKTLFKVGSKALIAGPILIPGADAVKDALAGGSDPVNIFVYEATGFSTANGHLDSGKVREVIVRDIALVGIGLGLRWAGRHI